MSDVKVTLITGDGVQTVELSGDANSVKDLVEATGLGSGIRLLVNGAPATPDTRLKTSDVVAPSKSVEGG